MRTDILTDEITGDEVLDADGDWVEGPTAQQEAIEALDTVKGAFTQFPTAGFGMVKWIRKTAEGVLVDEPKQFIRNAKVELEADGHKDPEVYVTNNFNDLDVKVEA